MMRGLGLATALVFAGWLSVASALGVTFRLESGETIEGAVIAATRNTVTIRPAVGGIRQIPVGRIERLEITTADGQRLRGRYHGWRDGRYDVAIKDGRIAAVAANLPREQASQCIDARGQLVLPGLVVPVGLVER